MEKETEWLEVVDEKLESDQINLTLILKALRLLRREVKRDKKIEKINLTSAGK